MSKRRSDDQKVILTVKFTNIIETNDHANIQVFNILMRNCLRHLKLTQIGRNFYDSKSIVRFIFISILLFKYLKTILFYIIIISKFV